MFTKLIQKTFKHFALTKYSKDIVENVLPTAPQLNKPSVIDT